MKKTIKFLILLMIITFFNIPRTIQAEEILNIKKTENSDEIITLTNEQANNYNRPQLYFTETLLEANDQNIKINKLIFEHINSNDINIYRKRFSLYLTEDTGSAIPNLNYANVFGQGREIDPETNLITFDFEEMTAKYEGWGVEWDPYFEIKKNHARAIQLSGQFKKEVTISNGEYNNFRLKTIVATDENENIVIFDDLNFEGKKYKVHSDNRKVINDGSIDVDISKIFFDENEQVDELYKASSLFNRMSASSYIDGDRKDILQAYSQRLETPHGNDFPWPRNGNLQGELHISIDKAPSIERAKELLPLLGFASFISNDRFTKSDVGVDFEENDLPNKEKFCVVYNFSSEDNAYKIGCIARYKNIVFSMRSVLFPEEYSKQEELESFNKKFVIPFQERIEALDDQKSENNTEVKNKSTKEEINNNAKPKTTNKKIDKSLSNRLKGRLLLATENKGRVFYVNPEDAKKYEVTFANALNLFKKLAIGINNENLSKISLATNNVVNSFGKQHLGKLFLQVEDHGRIWYVDMNGRRHEVTWDNLMDLFTSLSLGITNDNLAKIANEETTDTDNSENFTGLEPNIFNYLEKHSDINIEETKLNLYELIVRGNYISMKIENYKSQTSTEDITKIAFTKPINDIYSELRDMYLNLEDIDSEDIDSRGVGLELNEWIQWVETIIFEEYTECKSFPCEKIDTDNPNLIKENKTEQFRYILQEIGKLIKEFHQIDLKIPPIDEGFFTKYGILSLFSEENMMIIPDVNDNENFTPFRIIDIHGGFCKDEYEKNNGIITDEDVLKIEENIFTFFDVLMTNEAELYILGSGCTKNPTSAYLSENPEIPETLPTSNKIGYTWLDSLIKNPLRDSLNLARTKAKDARRVSDVKTISTVLELYNLKEGSFNGFCDLNDGLNSKTASLCESEIANLSTINDPINNSLKDADKCSNDSIEACNYSLWIDDDKYEVCFWMNIGYNSIKPGLNNIHQGGKFSLGCPHNGEEILDTDNDGLSDIDEVIYGTDINNPDSDGDSCLDGDEVEHGYNPMGEGKL